MIIINFTKNGIDYIREVYNNGTIIEYVKSDPPEPTPPEPAPEELNNLALMEGIAGLYETQVTLMEGIAGLFEMQMGGM